MPPRTRVCTLYRLSKVGSTHEDMFDALKERMPDLDELRANIEVVTIGEAPAIWLDWQSDHSAADWCGDASRTTGLRISRPTVNAAGLLLIAVDEASYAIGYGSGFQQTPDELIDPRFGLSFVVRTMDSEQIQDFVRRMPGAGGRTDATLAPGGLPVWSLNIEQHADVVSRVGGRLCGVSLTFTMTGRQMWAEGSAGLRMRLGVEPERLVADIREIARVCRDIAPRPEFEFVDHIRPIRDRPTLDQLEARLNAILSEDSSAGSVVPIVPTAALDGFRGARSFVIKIGSAPVLVHALEAEAFLQRMRVQPADRRARALRDGNVSMFSDDDAGERICGSNAAKWLEAATSLESRRFFMLEGAWHEIGADYVRRVQGEIKRLFGTHPSLDLPKWELGRGWEERDYNEHVASVRTGYLCLDRKGVANPLGRRSTLEVCDLLGPDNELVHVKRASGSAPLSQLFGQGLVSAQSLLFSPDVRRQFAARAAELGDGRVVDAAFRPKKVVFAILLKKGQALTPDTLFPFSQVTLASTARVLQSHQIDVELIEIESDT